MRTWRNGSGEGALNEVGDRTFDVYLERHLLKQCARCSEYFKEEVYHAYFRECEVNFPYLVEEDFNI